VVDDNDMSREVLYRTITSLGATADMADSGKMALELVRCFAQQGKHFDVILMDISMPHLDGLGTAFIIQKMPLLKLPAIIMVTAFGRDESGEKQFSEAPPYCDFLTKPVTPHQIFDAIIRATRVAPSVPDAPSSMATALPLSGLKLLVVEDNEMNRQIAFELLTDKGAEVILAMGGIEGVEKVVNSLEPFDVVIMDVQMPDIDGLEATRRIRADKKFASLPILAMTANASQEDRVECLAAGMTDHIGKPIDIDEVVKRILALGGKNVASPIVIHQLAPPALAGENLETVERILKRFSGKVDLYERMLAGFPSQMKTYLEKLLPEKNRAEAAKILHSIKGLASTMGAKGLADQASELEKLCKGENSEDLDKIYDPALQSLLPSFEMSVSLLNEQLQEYKRNATGQSVL
jgi:CheY-like chemotaxis protein